METILNESGKPVGYILEVERGYRAIRTADQETAAFRFRSSAVEWLGGAE